MKLPRICGHRDSPYSSGMNGAFGKLQEISGKVSTEFAPYIYISLGLYLNFHTSKTKTKTWPSSIHGGVINFNHVLVPRLAYKIKNIKISIHNVLFSIVYIVSSIFIYSNKMGLYHETGVNIYIF